MSSPQPNNHNLPTCKIESSLSFLQRSQLFKSMPVEILKLCAYLCKQEHFQKNEPIVQQGEPSDRVFLIIQGEVDICQEHHGTSYLVQHLTAHDFNYFGELALLARFDWFFSAWAATDVSLLTLDRKGFQKVCERYPQILPSSVERIVQVRIDRFVAQMDNMLALSELSRWQECTHA